MASDATRSADGTAGSTGSAGTDGDTGLDCAAAESTRDVEAASSSVPWMSQEGKGKDTASMGSEGSTRVELDSERTWVREKTPEILTSLEPVGSSEEGLAMLGCANVGVGACAGIGVGAASCAMMLTTFWLIRF